MTEELASLKYRKDDMVQGSVNLVTLKKVENYLQENCLHDNQTKGKMSCSEETKKKKQRQGARFSSTLSLIKGSCKIIYKKIQ